MMEEMRLPDEPGYWWHWGDTDRYENGHWVIVEIGHSTVADEGRWVGPILNPDATPSTEGTEL